jgi:hypothetical protein
VEHVENTPGHVEHVEDAKGVRRMHIFISVFQITDHTRNSMASKNVNALDI